MHVKNKAMDRRAGGSRKHFASSSTSLVIDKVFLSQFTHDPANRHLLSNKS